MTTLGDVTSDVLTYLYSFGVDRDKETALANNIDNTTDTSLTVVDGAQVDRGYIEVDDELMAVTTADRGSGLVTLQPWGRGAYGSVKATHSAGARVASNPRFPRYRVKATINMIVNEIYPQLFAVNVDSAQTVSVPKITYPVNAAAESIISMSVQEIGPSGRWRPINRFRFDKAAYSGSFNTGRSVDIFDPLPPGRIIKIVYRSKFSQFTGDDSQTFASVGLPDDYRGLIAMGAQARLLRALDASRLQLGSVESADRAQYNQPGGASQVARELFLQYQQMISEEKNRLLREYPTSLVRAN